MRNWMKWLAPMIGFAMLMALPARQSRADDTPAPVTAKIIVTVLDGSGKPVSGAQVRLLTRAKPAKTPDDAGQGQARPKPTSVAQGVTGSDGTVSFPNIAEGHYRVIARAKGVGRGMSRAPVTGSSDVTVSVTLGSKPAGTPNSPNSPNTPPDSK
jgi:hypothetical protein